jgi:hypothetical protein
MGAAAAAAVSAAELCIQSRLLIFDGIPVLPLQLH